MQWVKLLKFELFADDTNIFCSTTSLPDLQDLNKQTNKQTHKVKRSIQEQDKIVTRIEELVQAVTIQTDPEKVPPIMAWDVEAALGKI